MNDDVTIYMNIMIMFIQGVSKIGAPVVTTSALYWVEHENDRAYPTPNPPTLPQKLNGGL